MSALTSDIERRLGTLLATARAGPDVEALLRVIAAPKGEAEKAWAEWRKDHAIAGASARQWRLLGAVGRKLIDRDITPEDRNALAAIKREIWRDNQLRIRNHAPILYSLNDAGIPFMILKGGARMATQAGAMEIRHARDIDLLFPPDRLVDGLDALIGMGLRSVSGRLPGMVKSQAFARLHPPGRQGLDYLEIDVHSVPLRLGERASNEDAMWRRSMQGILGGVPVTVPAPADRFVHAIAHGLVADADAPVDWIVDAMVALDDPDFEPRVVAEESERRRIGVAIALGSLILERQLDVSVPAEIFEACSRDVSRLSYRLEMKGLLKLSRRRSPIDRLFAEIAERDRVSGRERVTRSWNTSWLFRPSLRAPSADWAAFRHGMARLPGLMPRSGISGRLQISLAGPNRSLDNRSFDLVLDGVWIGRVRLRMTEVLKFAPHRSWSAVISYRIPQSRTATRDGMLEVIALDRKKMPDAADLPGFRVSARALD
ncbi:nucleotidyltransferase family protein [Oricola sp.]|uniref:nucleotidyltransferase family protein n=1 Tax=Oricola sp. TaxID=1979950 RepID=UPI0025FB2341|nr:nucleotidyltransferase family protein [Oricola sp.]MCI5078372.1 nucleotidyltransferase family protein [Oricola sp.]